MEHKTPSELAALDAALRELRIEPRASLGPEIAGRAARGESPKRAPRRFTGAHHAWIAAMAAGIVAAVVAIGRSGYLPFLDRFASTQRIEVCCSDLDGVGGDDDGVIVETVAHRRVRRMMVYEEHDADRIWSQGELVRFKRDGRPSLGDPRSQQALVTREICCSDYDSGGVADDGLLVVSSPTGEVLLAALYDRPGAPADHLIR